MLGTNCPIPPNSNYTYKFQTKDQIGSFTYFPSTLLHRAAGGYGAINIYERPRIPIPFPVPDGDFTLLIGDWYKTSHKVSNIYFPFTLKVFSFLSLLSRYVLYFFENSSPYILFSTKTFPLTRFSKHIGKC